MTNATSRQLDALRCIAGFIAEHGYPPTRAEVSECLGVTVNATSQHIDGLERKGLIELDANIARGLRITASGKNALD